jgi:hypothetical protein
MSGRETGRQKLRERLAFDLQGLVRVLLETTEGDHD